MTNPLILAIEQRCRLNDNEKSVLEQAIRRTKVAAAGSDIVEQGSKPTESCLVLSGFAARYKILDDGVRQITAVHIPGDFVDLHSFLLKRMDHGVVALTACSIALVPHEQLRRITDDYPLLTRQLWLLTLIDAAIHREWISTVRLSAIAQLAHLMCEIYLRLRAVKLTDGHSFQLPMTQAETSDALGMSPVHLNRVLQELRGKGVVTWTGRTVSLLDWNALVEIAQFDASYLNLGDACDPDGKPTCGQAG